ncbi:hypothetical protein PBCV1_a627aR [Paramecium bursaria Chlorella virus 1]|uniref:Uncharacterized protein n=1 Tax=Paramecium bursaria Chlorella virus 1 TaxID=10506 RepID=F8TU74_PBCV1|nr:hypothetical protein PBCV1_a627aR [Paramecium bursaria Chlorella virus 1]AEI70135.1 hypothetical protein [Paramecium bursaria Chlorella virus 1]
MISVFRRFHIKERKVIGYFFYITGTKNVSDRRTERRTRTVSTERS